MKTPRCGKEDRLANFVLQGSSWPKKSLTYRILSYPTARGISKQDVDLETRKAFNMWQDVSGLSFDETSSNSADIKISFSGSGMLYTDFFLSRAVERPSSRHP